MNLTGLAHIIFSVLIYPLQTCIYKIAAITLHNVITSNSFPVESKQHPSTGGPLIWQLTETADSKVLGNRGRVRNKLSKLKERYAQIARTAEQKAKYAEEQLLLQKSNGQRNY